MRNYEVAFIIHPDLDKSAYQEIVDRVKGWIKDIGGTVTNTDEWGTKKLSYEIEKQTEGKYVIMSADFEPGSFMELERNLGLQESVLRFMITSQIPST